MANPISRVSYWRYPELRYLNPETKANDEEMWCDNQRQYEQDTRCGVCGDPVNEQMPRGNERGGRYWRDYVAGNYSAGQVIDIDIQSNTQNHGGGLEVQLCAAAFESEGCFVPLVLGNGDTFWPMRVGDGTVSVQTTARLPEGVTCERCTLRVHYRGAQNWDTCDNSKTCVCNPTSGDPPGGLGCGEQQTFRQCADVQIS